LRKVVRNKIKSKGETFMPINHDHVMSLTSSDQEFTYGDRETMLYALGIGMGSDPMDKGELPFVYENGLKTIPTMATVIAWGAGRMGDTGINYSMVVHGEQRVTMHKPLPSSATILADSKFIACLDKGAGKGAVLVGETTIRDKKDNSLLCTLVSSTFARADGGFGGPSEGGPEVHNVPSRAPDMEVDIPTRPDQALIYRLSGDRNPLHSDPDFAKMVGFPRPILHGLCTYGITCRAVMGAYCENDAAKILSHDVRFSAPVFPGETISVQMWRDGNVISFEARVKTRDVVVIKNGKSVLAD
jgi:acyl dehydratase